MSTLADRLKIALAESGKRKTDLWKACKITSGAVTQWFDGSVEQLESKNLLIVSDLLKVNSTWLATGKGRKELSASNVAQFQPLEEKDQTLDDLAALEPDEALVFKTELESLCAQLSSAKAKLRAAANKARRQKERSKELGENPGQAPPLERRRSA